MGSEMCIRDSRHPQPRLHERPVSIHTFDCPHPSLQHSSTSSVLQASVGIAGAPTKWFSKRPQTPRPRLRADLASTPAETDTKPFFLGARAPADLGRNPARFAPPPVQILGAARRNIHPGAHGRYHAALARSIGCASVRTWHHVQMVEQALVYMGTRRARAYSLAVLCWLLAC